MSKQLYSAFFCMASVLLNSSAQAAEKEKVYVTPAEHPTQVYFGDPHIHTRVSVDSSLWGNTLGPKDTYKFVRGGEVTSFKGWKAKLTLSELDGRVNRAELKRRRISVSFLF
jgi:opacity protein-like surface antigen